MFLYSSIVNMFVLSYPERGSIESNKSYKSYKIIIVNNRY